MHITSLQRFFQELSSLPPSAAASEFRSLNTDLSQLLRTQIQIPPGPGSAQASHMFVEGAKDGAFKNVSEADPDFPWIGQRPGILVFSSFLDNTLVQL